MATKGNKDIRENIAEHKQQQQQPQPTVDRDKVKQEREARRQAKVAAKQKVQDRSRDLPDVTYNIQKSEQKSIASKPNESVAGTVQVPMAANSNKVETSADNSGSNSGRKEQTRKKGESKRSNIATADTDQIANDLVKMKINTESTPPGTTAKDDGSLEKPEKKQLTKAERRAKQDADRAAKAAKATESKATSTAPSVKKSTSDAKATPSAKQRSQKPEAPSKSVVIKKAHRVKLFNHLYSDVMFNTLVNSNAVHPAIVRLGEQYLSGIVKGCNARGLAFMNAIKTVISEYETPSQKEFARSLEQVIKDCGQFLQQYRPLAVSVTNAMKFIQFQLRQLPKTERDAKVIKFKISIRVWNRFLWI